MTPTPTPEVTPTPTPAPVQTAAPAPAQNAPAATTVKRETAVGSVRMGVKLLREIQRLTWAGASVRIRDEALVYTEDELAAVSAIGDPYERVLMLLAALGLDEEADNAIRSRGVELSDAARDVIERVRAREVTPSAVSAFLSGTGSDAVHITLEITNADGTVTSALYSFTKDGAGFYAVN